MSDRSCRCRGRCSGFGPHPVAARPGGAVHLSTCPLVMTGRLPSSSSSSSQGDRSLNRPVRGPPQPPALGSGETPCPASQILLPHPTNHLPTQPPLTMQRWVGVGALFRPESVWLTARVNGCRSIARRVFPVRDLMEDRAAQARYAAATACPRRACPGGAAAAGESPPGRTAAVRNSQRPSRAEGEGASRACCGTAGSRCGRCRRTCGCACRLLARGYRCGWGSSRGSVNAPGRAVHGREPDVSAGVAPAVGDRWFGRS